MADSDFGMNPSEMVCGLATSAAHVVVLDRSYLLPLRSSRIPLGARPSSARVRKVFRLLDRSSYRASAAASATYTKDTSL